MTVALDTLVLRDPFAGLRNRFDTARTAVNNKMIEVYVHLPGVARWAVDHPQTTLALAYTGVIAYDQLQPTFQHAANELGDGLRNLFYGGNFGGMPSGLNGDGGPYPPPECTETPPPPPPECTETPTPEKPPKERPPKEENDGGGAEVVKLGSYLARDSMTATNASGPLAGLGILVVGLGGLTGAALYNHRMRTPVDIEGTEVQLGKILSLGDVRTVMYGDSVLSGLRAGADSLFGRNLADRALTAYNALPVEQRTLSPAQAYAN